MGLGLHDLKNSWRFRSVVENPWQAARARRSGKVGDPLLLRLRLRRGGSIQLRRRTSDVRVFRDVLVTDVYGLGEIERSGGSLGTVVDIGGHIGLFSIRASALSDRVITCEPVSSNRRLLEKNLQTTGCKNVQVVPKAVVGQSGPVRINLSGNPGGHSALTSETGGERVEEVEGVTLADVFSEYAIQRCDLLKLDCEGAEYEILEDSDPEILARIQRIELEYHDVRAVAPGRTVESLTAHLRASGFTLACEPSGRHPNVGLIHASRAVG